MSRRPHGAGLAATHYLMTGNGRSFAYPGPDGYAQFAVGQLYSRSTNKPVIRATPDEQRASCEVASNRPGPSWVVQSGQWFAFSACSRLRAS